MIKRYVSLLLALLFVALSSDLVFAQDKASNAFEKLKSLVGDWEGKSSEGQAMKLSYQVVSGGSALLETLSSADEPSMVTVYHLDGDRLMMTHYCSSGNQPRMSAVAPEGEVKSLDFTFIDATNLAKPSDGHIHGLTVTFQDKNQITQLWSWNENGKESQTTFDFQRKK